MWFLGLIALLLAFAIVAWAIDNAQKIVSVIGGILILAALYWLLKDHIDGIIDLLKYAVIGVTVIAVLCLILGFFGDYGDAKKENRCQRNEDKLIQVLSDTFNGKDIGYIRYEDVQSMFSRYANKDYPAAKTFHDILFGFIGDFEQQNFIKNETWAEPYVQRIMAMEMRTIKQLLQEVDGPLRHFVHFTPDETLLSQALDKYCQRKGNQAPPILKKDILEDGDTAYRPTEYGIRLHNKTLPHTESEEIDINDL